MRTDKTWGDGNVLTAAAHLYQHPIWVYTVDKKQPFKIEPEGIPCNTCPLTLGFVSELPGMELNHYVSLIESSREESVLQSGKKNVLHIIQ